VNKGFRERERYQNRIANTTPPPAAAEGMGKQRRERREGVRGEPREGGTEGGRRQNNPNARKDARDNARGGA
jgi:hypothetical protein